MKEYTKPILAIEHVEIEDIVASSNMSFGGPEPGDVEANWPWNKL